MDTEYTSEIKSEDEREVQRTTIECDIPAAAMPTEETIAEETAPNPIELPFWKPDDRDNVITHAIYRQLIELYIQEHETWDSQMRSDMLVESKSLDYRIFNSRGAMCSHILHKRMKQKVTWPRFWTLRVMFGPATCARQTWFPEVLKRFPDFASKSAYTGVVPPNFEEVLELNEWVPPAPTLEECGRPRVMKRPAASIGIRRFRRQKEGTNGVSNTSAMTAAAATASPTPMFTLLRSLETNSTGQSVEAPAAMSRQSMIALDFGTNEMPPPRDNGGLRSKFRPLEEVQSSQMNHLDMQNQVRELGDENIYLRQINAIQQRLIEQYQERILRLEAESRVMRGRG
ncbi:uncharacterized protein TrAtP1_003512 [Trichoderma atroviride]|uniref:uncharacterized protein n=1 Tax=Hypocrea atroviridis TaxID=63577 RepID=UPI003317EB0D|nr:hypothetical protein TrAtP1_003512 [Trichoderma atroviride]